MPRVIILPDGTQIIAGDAIETYVSEEDKEKSKLISTDLVFHQEQAVPFEDIGIIEQAEVDKLVIDGEEVVIVNKIDTDDGKDDGALLHLNSNTLNVIDEIKIENEEVARSGKGRKKKLENVDIKEVKTEVANVTPDTTTTSGEEHIDLGFQVDKQ